MKNIKKIIVTILTALLCFNFATIDSEAAASVSIALSSGSTSVGGSVSVTVSVSGSDVSAYDIYVSYDSSVLQYSSGSGAAQANGGGGSVRLVGTGAGSTTLTFSAIGNGTSYISTSGAEVYDIDYNQLSISHAGASVTVATPTSNTDNNDSNNDNNNDDQDDSTQDDRSSNCNLKSLQISPGTLEPAFSPSTTSYFVQVDEDVTSMVVSAVAEDDKATTAVRGAGLIEPGANTVTVTVTAENGAVKVYTLSVAAGEVLGDAKAVIDGKEYAFVQDSSGLEFPEGFTEITTTYKDWDVLAFESPNKRIVLVCLEPKTEDGEESELEWFIYDKDKESFTPYREYSSDFNRYVIIEAPEGVAIPEGFEKVELDIGGIGERVIAYKSDAVADGDLYLVYAINISGDEGFYWYDAKEKAFLRYSEMEIVEQETPVATETAATVEEPEAPEEPVKDEGFFSKRNLTFICIGLMVLVFLLLIWIITLIVLMKKDDSDEDDEDSQDEDEAPNETIIINGPKIKSDDKMYDKLAPSDIKKTDDSPTEDDVRKAYEEDREPASESSDTDAQPDDLTNVDISEVPLVNILGDASKDDN